MPISRERSLFSHTLKGKCYYIKSKPVRPDNSNTKYSPYFKTTAGDSLTPNNLTDSWFTSFIATGEKAWTVNASGITLDFSSFTRDSFFYKYELYVRKVSDKIPLTLSLESINNGLNYKNGTSFSASDVICTTDAIIDTVPTEPGSTLTEAGSGGGVYINVFSTAVPYYPFGSNGSISNFAVLHNLSVESQTSLLASLGLGSNLGNNMNSMYFLNDECFVFFNQYGHDKILRGIGGTTLGDHPIGTEVHHILAPTQSTVPDISSSDTLFNFSGVHGETYLIWAREVNLLGNMSDWTLMVMDTIPVDELLETIIEDFGEEVGGGGA